MEIVGLRGLIGILILMCLGVVTVYYITHTRRIPIRSVMGVCIIIGYIAYSLSPIVLHQAGVFEKIEISEKSTRLISSFDLKEPMYLLEADVHNAAAFGIGTVMYTSKTWNESSEKMLQGVTAHEKGHLVYQHMLWKLIYLGVIWGLLVYLRGYMQRQDIHLGYQISILLISCLLRGLGYIQLQRSFEREADRYAAQQGHAQGLIEYFELSLLHDGEGKRNSYNEFLHLHEDIPTRIGKLKEM